MGKINGNSSLNGATNVNYSTAGGDYAEYFRKENANEVFNYGDLVCINTYGNVVKCDNNNTKILGVVSDTYGFTGNDKEQYESNPQYVGLIGQIRTTVNIEGGTVQPGDMLTYSSVSGVAKKATKAGFAVGKAIDGGTSGRINAYINPTWYDPDVYITTAGNLNVIDLTANDSKFTTAHNFKLTDALGNQINRVGAFSEVAAGKLKAGLVDSTQITTNALAIASENLTINGQNIRDYIASVATSSALIAAVVNTNNQTASNSALITTNYVKSQQLEISGDATISGNLTTGTLLASHIPALEMLSARVSNLENTIASLSSAFVDSFTTATASAQFASLDNLDVKDATISGTLNVLGRTTVSELGVTGKINSGLLVINGLDDSVVAGQTAVSINTLDGDLYLQNRGLGGVNIAAGKVTIDTLGNIITQGVLSAQSIETSQITVKGSGSIGSTMIPAGITNVSIYTPLMKLTSKVFITPTTQPLTPLTVSAKGNGWFTVSVASSQITDIKFDWMIIGTQ